MNSCVHEIIFLWCEDKDNYFQFCLIEPAEHVGV